MFIRKGSFKWTNFTVIPSWDEYSKPSKTSVVGSTFDIAFSYLIDYSECKYRDLLLGIISVFSWQCLRKQWNPLNKSIIDLCLKNWEFEFLIIYVLATLLILFCCLLYLQRWQRQGCYLLHFCIWWSVNCISFSTKRTVLSVVSTSSDLLDNHMTFSNVHWLDLVKAMHLLSHHKLGKSLIRHVITISGRIGQ